MRSLLAFKCWYIIFYTLNQEPENDQHLSNSQYPELISNASVSWEEQRCDTNEQPTKAADDQEDAKYSGNKRGTINENPERQKPETPQSRDRAGSVVLQA